MAQELEQIDRWWRAANYLAVGMIYLQDNPLLRSPLQHEHVKNRLLGHWGSSPGQAFIWAHANRVIRERELDMIYLSGPGHGAPGVLAPTYLDGSYSEVYPDKSTDAEGMHRFFKQFSFPGHIGSHCTPETPGSIHEGGELGYVLSHACGAVFDNPELIALACVGDGEAETGPLDRLSSASVRTRDEGGAEVPDRDGGRTSRGDSPTGGGVPDLGDVVGVGIKGDVLDARSNGLASNAQWHGTGTSAARSAAAAANKMQPASRTHREQACGANRPFAKKAKSLTLNGETRGWNVLGYFDGSDTINDTLTVPSQSSVGQTGIERHPMAPPIVA